jgi:hypothetical protein
VAIVKTGGGDEADGMLDLIDLYRHDSAPLLAVDRISSAIRMTKTLF